MIKIDRIDHFVLTVVDMDATIRFYTEILGMTEATFNAGRKALTFGQSKINLHLAGHEFEPKAGTPTPGSADLCLIVEGDIGTIERQLGSAGIRIEVGPVEKIGALGPMLSIYIRDPDRNLIELSTYLAECLSDVGTL